MKAVNYRHSKKIQGSSLVLAIFVMTVLLLFGVSLMQVLSTSNETIAQEVLGTRALNAANSGMQAQLQKLFPIDGVGSACPATTPYNNLATVEGLNNCRADVTCDNYVTDNNGVKYYRLISTGQCGTGAIAADSTSVVLSSRTVQVEARELP